MSLGRPIAWPLLAVLALGPAPTTAPRAEPPDPDTLVVDTPTPPDTREPKEDINKLLRAEFSILQGLQDLELDAARREDELGRLREQEAIVEADLGKMAERFDQLTQEIDRARELVQRRLRAMIQLKRTEPYQVLFASETYERFLRRKRGLEALLDVDRKRIADYREQLDTWREARDDLERRRTNLLRTRKHIEHTLQQLTWDREEKQALLDAVRERRSFYGKVDQEMETVDAELREKVEALGDPDRSRLWFEENKGKLPMPMWKGRIVGRFGVRTHKTFKTRTVHRGIDVLPEGWDGKREVKIRSIYWGYVAHAGWIRGLGQTVIIDHTRGYMSLYAHMGEITVSVGDKIRTSGHIGFMGESGSLHGPRLYLEIRKDGKAIDPAPWVR